MIESICLNMMSHCLNEKSEVEKTSELLLCEVIDPRQF